MHSTYLTLNTKDFGLCKVSYFFVSFGYILFKVSSFDYEICSWNVWSYHYSTFMFVIMNSLIVTVYPSAPWIPICSPCHIFLFLFRYTRLDGYPCSQFLVEFDLLICFYFSVHVSLMISCSLQCVSVFHVLCSARSLVLLNTLSISATLILWFLFLVFCCVLKHPDSFCL